MRLVFACLFALPAVAACGSKSEVPAPADRQVASATDTKPSVPPPGDSNPATAAANPTPAPANPTPAAPTPPPVAASCAFPGLVMGAGEGRQLGSTGTIGELAKALRKDAGSDEEALSLLCRGQSASTCNAEMVVYAASEDQGAGVSSLSVFVRSGKAGDGPWVGFQRLVPTDPNDESEVVRPPVVFDDGRLVAVVVARTEKVFGSQCDPEGGCELDSETFGAAAIDIVIDRERKRHVFTSFAAAWGDVRCDDHVAPSLLDGAFVRTDCSGKTERFTTEELAACNPRAHGTWAATHAERFRAEKAKAEGVLQGRAGGAVQPAGPKPDQMTAGDHLAEGRRLTREKKYGEAIAAFTAASDADPELLEALSGRCYAKVLRAEGDDLKGAIDDCDSVRTDIQGSRYDGNKRFASAVSFNIGLAYEKLGQTSDALDAFEHANTVAPSEAAAKKITALKER